MNGYLLRSSEGATAQDLAAKVTAESSGGLLGVVELHTAAGTAPHLHKNEDVTLYVLDGVLTVRCGEDTWEVDRGCVAYLPRDVCHWWGVNTLGASLLIITSPAGDTDERALTVVDAARTETAGIVWC
jgi:quercetin dioxygenase-like cupin family protein